MKESLNIYGWHAVLMLLEKRPEHILEIMLQTGSKNKNLPQIITLSQQFGISLQQQAKTKMDALAKNGNHQGVIAKCRPITPFNDKFLYKLVSECKHSPLLIILDEVQDPHNLGAILRTADAAKVDAVIIPKNKSCGLTSTVHKVAAGASICVPVIEAANLSRTMEELKKLGVWLIGTTGTATKNLYQLDGTTSLALVLGAEGSGMRRLTAENCDDLIKIPMQGSVESLNVSVATGVCLFEIVRQRSIS